MTLAQTLRPRTAFAAQAAYDIIVVLFGSALLALAAQAQIRLPFTPVPITAQTFAVLIVGMLLGSRRALAAVAAYLGQGALGLPVFAGLSGGLLHVAGPTGGYLLAFLPAAYVVGLFAERGWDRQLLKSLCALGTGAAIILAGGSLWLSLFIGLDRALILGVLPFIPGEIVKLAVAAALLPSLRRIV